MSKHANRASGVEMVLLSRSLTVSMDPVLVPVSPG